MNLISTTIPAWIVAMVMIYTGLIWFVSRNREIRMDSRLFGHVFIVWGFIYLTFQYLPLDIEVRAFISRIMLMLICLSQSIPLTMSYIRSHKNANPNS